MELILDAEGINISFEIKGYKKEKNSDNPIWCKCSSSFISDSWLNYSIKNSEVLACDEVEYLFENLQKLLDGQLKEDLEIEFIEPDFSFELITEKDLREDDRYDYIAKGYEIVDIKVFWCVHFWDDGALTDNYLKICLDREEIVKLRDYLKNIVG